MKNNVVHFGNFTTTRGQTPEQILRTVPRRPASVHELADLALDEVDLIDPDEFVSNIDQDDLLGWHPPLIAEDADTRWADQRNARGPRVLSSFF